MKTFRVYTEGQQVALIKKIELFDKMLNKKSKETSEEDKFIFIKEGFSLYAYIFSVFWFLYHKAWFCFFLVFAIVLGVMVVELYGLIDPTLAKFLNIGLSLLIAFEANDLYASEIEKKGYVLKDVVVAKNLEEAKWRFFDEYYKNGSNEVPSYQNKDKNNSDNNAGGSNNKFNYPSDRNLSSKSNDIANDIWK